MLNIYDSIACYTECETFQGFTCLSFEYRTDISVCTLVNERPNKENFIQIPNMDKIKVYERACAGMTFFLNYLNSVLIHNILDLSKLGASGDN